jgi:TetR/AcrR family transcriptional regulator, transcriptional repressor for nem operon
VRYKPGHREESKQRILSAVGRGFRERGYEGIGVDGLAQAAGVTSGAFYSHFPSKTEAFKEAIIAGLRELLAGVQLLQEQYGDEWVEPFIDFYLSSKRTCELGDSCAMQSLTPEVFRSERDIKEIYETELLEVVGAIAKRLPQASAAERRNRAWALVSILSGAVSMSRALADDALATRAAKAVRTAALAIATTP